MNLQIVNFFQAEEEEENQGTNHNLISSKPMEAKHSDNHHGTH